MTDLEDVTKKSSVVIAEGGSESVGDSDFEGLGIKKISSKRLNIKAKSSKAAQDAAMDVVKRRGRKKKKKQEVMEEEEEKKHNSPLFFYDEYEEDITLKPWTPPKPRVPPRPSALLRDWAESQPIPERVKGKKTTKKQLKKLAKERERAAAIEADKIRNRIIRQMQEEIRLEMYHRDEQDTVEEDQLNMRKAQLGVTWYKLFDNEKAYMDYELENKGMDAWDQYMRCDGLPDPGILSDLNTYLFLWALDDEEANMEMVAKKSEVVIYLLRKLENIIQFSIMNPKHFIEECIRLRQQFRDKLQFWLDIATYRLLRQIERDMMREDMRNATYMKKSNEMICCIWVLIRLPISIKQIAERDNVPTTDFCRKAIEIRFEEINLTVKMPMDVDCYCMGIRGMWVTYDHYSDQTRSFNVPELPEEYQMNMELLAYCQNEYDKMMRIREDQKEGRRLRLEEKKALAEKMANPPLPPKPEKKKPQKVQYGRVKKPEPEPEPEPLPYLPTPEEIILMEEVEARKEVRRLLYTRCEKTELNLRKYAILGGAIHIDLVYQPPQPKDMRGEIYVTTLQVPKELRFVPFSKPYKAPPPPQDSERSPEVIEAEMKALEAAMDLLALVTLKLPDTVLWFEPPMVAHWIPEMMIWSSEDVHDIKYNEEKQIITFRTGRLGVHGLASFRWINLPFQSWELKPESGKGSGGGVILSITAAIVQAEFIVREDLVCLHSLIGGATSALQELIDRYMKLHFLIMKMRAGGCDLFPDTDTWSYLKGLPIKHPVAEKHLQQCMGLLCTVYIFSWSRWNAACTPRQIVMQLKEIHGCVAKQQSNMTLLVTPLTAAIVQCTEVSTEFSSKSVDEQTAKFYSDLYHLALHNVGIKSRISMKDVSFKLATTVTRLLQRTKVISMSS